jgi:hypothetical protein
VIKKIIVTSIATLMVGCASFEPKPGMSFEQFRSMTALSFNGSVIPLGKLTGTNIDVYETFDQNNKRVPLPGTIYSKLTPSTVIMVVFCNNMVGGMW